MVREADASGRMVGVTEIGPREWLYGDDPCTYPGECSLPLRTHIHISHGPSDPFHVEYYDEMEPARTARRGRTSHLAGSPAC